MSRALTIDPARTATLGDGWRAAVCLDRDGTETCWVVAPDLSQPVGCACSTCAPHDQLHRAADPTTRSTP